MKASRADLVAAVAQAELAGWHLLHDAGDPGGIAAVVRSLGSPLHSRTGADAIERLTPRAPSAAPTRSLSAVHGTGAFPFHSDGAHWTRPPRWLLLWCESADGGRPTLLAPWADVAPSRGSEATFVVRNGRDSFFVEVGQQARFDTGCMIPQDARARSLTAAVAAIEPGTTLVSVAWRPGDLLIVDNHAMLHARAVLPANEREERRVLWRALLSEVRP